MPSPPPPRNSIPSLGCGYLICLLAGIAGLALLYVAQERFAQRRQPDGWIAATFGLAFCAAAVGMLGPMQRAVAQAKERVRREAAKPGQPWTWDPQWTDPNGVVQAPRRHGRALVFGALAALVLSSPALFLMPQELRRGNHAVLVALVFPVAGVALLGVAAADAWRRRKYGVARFMPAVVPIPWGGELSGMIIVTRPVFPSGPGRVSLECWSTRVERSGNKRVQRDEAIAHTEREVEPREWATAAGESRLFVQVPVRRGQPTSMAKLTTEQPAFEWRLRAEFPTAGADFVAEFVLPVFAVPGAAGEGTTNLAAAAGALPRRVEAWRAAAIREVPQPGARGDTALVFARGLGRRLVATPFLISVFFVGIAVALWVSPVPKFIPFFLAAVGVVPALSLKMLWSGGGERVWVEGQELSVQRGSEPPCRVSLPEILRVESSKSIGVGAQQFHRVVVRTRPPRERHFPGRFEVASMVRGDEAATEVVAWLEERLTLER